MERLMRLANTAPALILRSPLHPLLSRRFLLLSLRGRRTGQRYTLPIAYVQRDDDLVLTTDSRWWRNLRGGAPVEVLLKGHWLQGQADVDPSSGALSVALQELVAAQPAYLRLARVPAGPDGTADVAAAVAAGRVALHVRLLGRAEGNTPPPIEGGTILLTGASAGIGRELANLLGMRARTLVLVARRRERLEQLARELRSRNPRLLVQVEACDLSDPSAIDAMLERVEAQVGPVDVLVNDAGVGDQALYEQASWPRIRHIVDVNVVAPALLTHRLLGGMVARRRGGILNINSGAGVSIVPGAAAYTGSKHFMSGWTEALRAEVADVGVVVTQVCPGPVETEFDAAAGIRGLQGGPPQFMRLTAGQCAREALQGFERGQAIVFPGTAYGILMLLLGVTPRSVQRTLARRAARRLRAHMN
jgi:uncharacterized protein